MHTMLNVVVMVQTKYIQQWCPLAIYLGDAEDKRKKHGEEREREEKERKPLIRGRVLGH